MTEEIRENQTDCWNDNKNCIINIFCDGKKSHSMGDQKKNGHCIINIFCCGKKNDNNCTDENNW